MSEATQAAMIERVARAIATRNGDDFDLIPRDKPHWTAERGEFGGRFRDVNAPHQCDYLDMAEAAIEAMRSPDVDMLVAGAAAMYDYYPGADEMLRCWQAAIDEALTAA